MNDKMAIFIFSVNVINRLLLSFLVLTKVITLSGVHCIFVRSSIATPEERIECKSYKGLHKGAWQFQLCN